MAPTTNAPCPVCSNKKKELVFTTSSSEVAGVQADQFRDSHRFNQIKREVEKIWGKKTCNVVKCEMCSFVYADPYKAGTPKYFSLVYNNNQYPSWREEYDIVLGRIKEIVNKTGEIEYLEIGAGNGDFAKEVSKRFQPKHLLCLELSKSSIEIMEKKGLNCIETDIKNLKTNHKFSIVSMFAVLPYMGHTGELFRKLNQITFSKADIFISFVGDDWIDFGEKVLGFRALPPNTIGRWNKDTLEKICNIHGFYIAEFQKIFHSRLSIAKNILFTRYSTARKKDYLPRRIYSIKNKFIRRFFSLLILSLYIPYAIRVMPSKSLCKVQIAHIRKIEK